MYIIEKLIKCTFSRNCFHTSNIINLRDMIKNVPKFGQNIDNLLLCKQRIQVTGKLYVRLQGLHTYGTSIYFGDATNSHC